MYLTRWYKAGEYLFIRNCTFKGFGAPGQKRTRRMRDTPKAMSKYNNNRRAEKLQMLILENFDQGFHVVLDYPKDDRPQTYEEAEKNLTKCLHKVSRSLKKKDIKFKYIAITERGKRAAALHHHMIIEDIPEVVMELKKVWGNHLKFFQMYEDGAYKDLADYFCKIETKEEQTKGKSKYHRSRNLKEPLHKTAIAQGQIRQEPVVPKGYILIRDSLVNGVNEMVGVRYQRYTLRRIVKGSSGQRRRVRKPHKKAGVWQTIKNIFSRERRR